MSTNYIDKSFFACFSDKKREEALLFILSKAHTYNREMEEKVKKEIEQKNPLHKTELPKLSEDEAYKIYKKYADQDKYSLETASDINQVINFVKLTGTDSSIIQVMVEDEYNETLGDIILYLIKYETEKFFNLYGFAEAYSNESKNWSEFDIIPRDDEIVPIDDTRPEGIDDFALALSSYFKEKQNDGTGKEIDIKFIVVSESIEYYVCFISKPATDKTIMNNGKAENIRIVIPENVSIKFDRATNKVYICSPKFRCKKKIVEYWADRIKGCDVSANSDEGNRYNIQHIFDNQLYDFSNVPYELNLENAKLIEMRLTIPGDGIARFSCNKKDSFFEKFNANFNHQKIRNQLCYVQGVKIAICLNSSFGRSCNQTIEITKNATNVDSKNPKVVETLRKIVNYWEKEWSSEND